MPDVSFVHVMLLYSRIDSRVWDGPGDVLFLVQAAAFTVSSALVFDSFLKISLQEWTDNCKGWCYWTKELRQGTMTWMVSSDFLTRVVCSHPCIMIYTQHVCIG